MQQMSGTAEDAACDLPSSLGLVGVGTIGSAVVRGLCSFEAGPRDFVLGPRNAGKAAVLAAEFPDKVRVAGSNQEVVDAVSCVVVAVLPRQGEEVLGALRFREGQRVLSLISTLPLERLQELLGPGVECAIGVPLPAVAHRQGTSLLFPRRPFGEAIFNALGTCIAVDDLAHFRRLQTTTALMGDFYKRQLTVQEWLLLHGVPEAHTAAWVGAVFATFAADSGKLGSKGFAALVAEQTPGGMNEMVLKDQDTDGSYEALKCSLDTAHHRFSTGLPAPPELTPAAVRKRKLEEGS